MDVKKDQLLSNAIIFNGVHLTACLVFNFLYTLAPGYILVVSIVAIIAQVLIWFLGGFRYVLFEKTRSVAKMVLYFLVCMIPMGLLLGATFFLGSGAETAISNYWPAVFFISSPLLLWHRMGVALGYILQGSIYYVISANIAVMFFSSFLGGLFARPEKQKKRRRRKRAIPSETEMLQDTMVLKKQDLGPKQHFPPSDATTKVFSKTELDIDFDEEF